MIRVTRNSARVLRPSGDAPANVARRGLGTGRALHSIVSGDDVNQPVVEADTARGQVGGETTRREQAVRGRNRKVETGRTQPVTAGRDRHPSPGRESGSRVWAFPRNGVTPVCVTVTPAASAPANVALVAVGTGRAIPVNMKREQQNLTETIVAVCGPRAWEIYETVEGLEIFSHFATKREAAELDRRQAWGGTWG